MKRLALLFVWLLAWSACPKVPLELVEAVFNRADAVWFEDEETLFFFYDVRSPQGLAPEAQVEVGYLDDDVFEGVVPLQRLTPVHTHVPVECPRGLCGSWSTKVSSRPRLVWMRLRYHRDGALIRNAELAFFPVPSGPPHLARSLVVYGVFDEANRHVQWRARNTFPNLRNDEAFQLGLRRWFQVQEPAAGSLSIPPDNPYGYGVQAGCAGLTPVGWPDRESEERGLPEPSELPLSASAEPLVCARSVVRDARGTFVTAAVARKTPEVEPAFPELRTPIREALPLDIEVRPCGPPVSASHLEMQRQRLLFDGGQAVWCLEDVAQASWPERRAVELRLQVEAARDAGGRDMVAKLLLHHDGGSTVPQAVESALERVLTFERERTTPRLAGAFVLDSFASQVRSPPLRPLALVCPFRSLDDLDLVPAQSSAACAAVPDLEVNLGPFRLSTLPILPSRAQYLNFVSKHSVAQAGRARALTFRVPLRTAISRNIALGELGVATFFDDESVVATASQAFSYCLPPVRDGGVPDGGPVVDVSRVVFNVSGVPVASPLAQLPQLHLQLGSTFRYTLGLAWESNFLTRLLYEVPTGLTLTVVGLSVPLGVAQEDTVFLGSAAWSQERFPLGDTLQLCTRFCTHPTFNGAGIYEPLAPFVPTYTQQCYRPAFPDFADGGYDDP